MCATDQDPDLQEIAEDELAPRSDQHARAAQQPGVAWGLADLDLEAASAS
jgi:hypothetical protein